MMPNYARPMFDPKRAERLQKPIPRRLEKRQADAAVKAKDEEERAVCRARSGGQCEVRAYHRGAQAYLRCKRRVSENHHLLGGSGRRNKGRSILAGHRLDVCKRCHEDITGYVLLPVDATTREYAATVVYEYRKV